MRSSPAGVPKKRSGGNDLLISYIRRPVNAGAISGDCATVDWGVVCWGKITAKVIILG